MRIFIYFTEISSNTVSTHGTTVVVHDPLPVPCYACMFFTLYTPRFPPIFLEQDPRRRENAHAGKRVGSDIATNVVGQMARQGDQTYYVRNNTIGVRQRSYIVGLGVWGLTCLKRVSQIRRIRRRERRDIREGAGQSCFLRTQPACLCKKQKSYVYLFRYKTYIYFSYSIEKHAFIV